MTILNFSLNSNLRMFYCVNFLCLHSHHYIGGVRLKPKIVCIVGESGSGKSLLVDALGDYGYKELYSYTTRPKRDENDKKTFVSKEEFDALFPQMVAHTHFDGHYYGATKQQVEDSHLYIIDPYGIDQLLRHYSRQEIKIVYLHADKEVRLHRLITSRETDEAQRRIAHDKDTFHDFKQNFSFDIMLPSNNIDDFALNIEILKTMLKRWFPTSKEECNV